MGIERINNKSCGGGGGVDGVGGGGGGGGGVRASDVRNDHILLGWRETLPLNCARGQERFVATVMWKR